MAKYSIITPMYNSFDLMQRYFESLEHQTYKDFEVIIIDDCSTDGSYEQVSDYRQKSPLNIILLRTLQNSGPGNARNLGMQAATGEWITFIDNDDWVDITLLEKIENIAKSYSVNCIVFDYLISKRGKAFASPSLYCDSSGLVDISKCIAYCRNHTVGKVYKLSKCREKNISFPTLRRCEDVAFVCRAIDACGSVYYLKEPLYYYYQRSSSLSNNSRIDETDMVKAFSLVEKSLKAKYPKEIEEKSVSDLLYGGVLMMCKTNKSRNRIVKYIDDYNSRYPDWHRCDILNYLGTGKRLFLFAVRRKLILTVKILTFIHTKLIA